MNADEIASDSTFRVELGSGRCRYGTAAPRCGAPLATGERRVRAGSLTLTKALQRATTARSGHPTGRRDTRAAPCNTSQHPESSRPIEILRVRAWEMPAHRFDTAARRRHPRRIPGSSRPGDGSSRAPGQRPLSRRGVPHLQRTRSGADYYRPVQIDDALADALRRAKERIAAYRGQDIGEQNTKAGLITPLIRALGWDTEDLREVHLEFKPKAADKPVDYALLLNGQPRMFVEAKSLEQNLDDRRWANQIMGYAAVAGVRWVVLTNGDEYRLYNAHASVPVEEKLFRKIFVSQEGTVALETLSLLSKESVAELESLWQEDFIDRQVQAALDALFEPEPDPGLLRLLRRRLPTELKPQEIRASLARLRSPGGDAKPELMSGPRPAVAPAKPTSNEGPAYGEGTPWNQVTLGDIVSAGLLRPPVELYRRYKGHDLRARVESDGRVSYGGQVYGSLSVAGQMARRSVIGADQRAQTNGWTFWKFSGADGALHEIDELRRQLWETRTASP